MRIQLLENILLIFLFFSLMESKRKRSYFGFGKQSKILSDLLNWKCTMLQMGMSGWLFPESGWDYLEIPGDDKHEGPRWRIVLPSLDKLDKPNLNELN